ncbi:MAG: Release factor glutamine methyltransferase [Pseudomonadota bacterium]|jgi:release factor glutamine methyltransferase|nr:peptide chain release factor N(5)-glutamine methyltransferase [Burkholderiales bacterium]
MNVASYKIKDIILNSTLPLNETKILLRHVLNLSAAQLIMYNEQELTSAQYKEFCYLCNQRINNVPLNYITGTKEFYSREFKVNNSTLIPRPETEQIVDIVLAIIAQHKNIKKVLDLGTGSGVIAITIKLEAANLEVVALDKFKETLEIAQANAKRLNAQVKFYLSDWFNCISEKFDIIVSNPPYIARDDNHLQALVGEPLSALTDFADGLLHLQHIIVAAPNFMQGNAYLILEHGYNQGEQIRQIFKNNGYINIKTYQDIAKLDRITIGEYHAT